MGGKRILTDAEEREILERRLAGEKWTKLENRFKLSRETMRKILRKRGW